VPTLGVFLENDTIPLVVSLHMSCGAVVPWSKNHENPETMAKILQGAADGLAYLHSQDPPVIHGSIHPNNILVNDEGEAVLCDFGIDRLLQAAHDSYFSIRPGANWRYMAPELFTVTGALRPTEASDIYALAMAFMTIVTCRPPFLEYDNDFDSSSASQEGKRPSKPDTMMALTTSQADTLWVLLTSMWDHDSSARPSAMSVYDYLKWRLRPHRVGMPLDPSTGNKRNPRARTVSSVTPQKRAPFSVDNGVTTNKPLGRGQHRARVFSVPSMPKLEALAE